MMRNIYIVGERSINGNFGKVMSAGEVYVSDSNIKKLYAAGEVEIKNSKIHKCKCAGEFDGESIEINNMEAAGEITLKGLCKIGQIVVVGELEADFLECKIFRCGLQKKRAINRREQPEISGKIIAETFENIEEIDLNFDYEFKNIISSDMLRSSGEIMCENFYSFGPLAVEDINCENVFILCHHDVRIQNITGSEIQISDYFSPDKKFKAIPKSLRYGKISGSKSIIEVSSIEGDKISVKNTKANFVAGDDIIIGPGCTIERVEYRGAIKISDKSIVKEVIKV